MRTATFPHKYRTCRDRKDSTAYPKKHLTIIRCMHSILFCVICLVGLSDFRPAYGHGRKSCQRYLQAICSFSHAGSFHASCLFPKGIGVKNVYHGKIMAVPTCTSGIGQQYRYAPIRRQLISTVRPTSSSIRDEKETSNSR